MAHRSEYDTDRGQKRRRFWPIVLSGLAILVLSLVGYRWFRPGNGPTPGAAAVASRWTQYTPGESERKLEEFRKAKGGEYWPTEGEVVDIMGQPTRMELPVSTGADGRPEVVTYTSYWESQDRGIRSQVSFTKGRAYSWLLNQQINQQ